MKTLYSIARQMLPSSEPKIVEFIACAGGWKKLEMPTMSSSLDCVVCGSKDHYAVFCDPAKDARKVRICAHGNCESNTSVFYENSLFSPPKIERSISWLKFCEVFDIGDRHHDVKFESINQSAAKIDYMSKFCQKPCDLIVMQGPSGSGKTYSAMAMCELYTRKSSSCIFVTQVKLRDEWLKMARGEQSNVMNKIRDVNLLVVDDFGTGEVTSSFLTYFLEIINSRMQWSDRGTIITTNLSDEKISEFCGEALTDRLKTGQMFSYTDSSRRRKKVL